MPWSWILLGITWIPFVLPVPGWEVAAFVYVIGIGVLAWKGHGSILLTILLTPYFLLPAFHVARAIADYHQGRAELRTYGLVKRGVSFRIDPDTRCRYRPMGCVMDGSEIFTSLPYNTTVRALTRTHGWMPGAYDGPCPGFEEIGRLVFQCSDSIFPSEMRTGAFLVDGLELRLEPLFAEMALDLLSEPYRRGEQNGAEVRAVVLEDRCLILGVVHNSAPRGASAGRFSAVLIDLDTGNVVTAHQDRNLKR